MRSRGRGDEAEYYERNKHVALSVLRRRCPWLDADDREGVYHDAFAGLLAKERDGTLDLAAMHEAQVRSYLLTASMHRAMNVTARSEHRLTTPVEAPGDDVADSRMGAAEQMVAESERTPVRELVEELPERCRAVIKLRFWLDFKPPEIQRYLGISERAYRKEIERAYIQLADRYELVREGRWCAARRSVILAYMAGVAGPSRALEARMHLDSCPGCSHMAAELRRSAERAAAILPLPAMAPGAPSRVGELVAAAKAQLWDLKAGVAGFVSRSDTSSMQLAAGARPGAAVAAIASCVAIGSGATYCAVQGLPDPVRALASAERHTASDPTPRPATSARAEEPSADVSPPVVEATAPTPTPRSIPSPPAAAHPVTPPATAAQEFEPTAAAARASPPAIAADASPADSEFGASSDSTPAGGAGGGEFAP